VTAFPAGADQVAVRVCTLPTPCTAGQFVTGPPQPGPGLKLPDGVDPATVTGVDFVFSNSHGTPLVNGGSAGSVQFQLKLRDTVRSTGAPLDPASTLTQDNCATPSATDTRARAAHTTVGDQVCKSYSILSAIPDIGGSKQFFADANGSYTPNGYPVAGQKSGISALATATNNSSVPVSEMTITEPSATAPSVRTGIDVNKARLVFPAGATEAAGHLVCSDGTTVPFTATPPPTTVDVIHPVCPTGTVPTKVTVTFTGTIPDIAAAAGSDVVTGGELAKFGSAPAQLVLTPGTIQLGTQKPAAPTSVAPGTPITYTLKVTNTGTGAVPALLVTEPIPAGLVFDPTYAGDGGQPKEVAGPLPHGSKVGPFTIGYSCVVTDSGGKQTVVAKGSDSVAAGKTLNATRIPAGAVCTITEEAAPGAQITLPDPITIPAGDGITVLTATATVTNTYGAPRLLVVKHVTGTGIPSGVQYAVRVDCTLDGKPVAGSPKTVEVSDGSPLVLTDVPVGAHCTATETDSHGAVSTAIVYSDGDDAVIHADKDATITVTNTFVAPPTPPTPTPKPAPKPWHKPAHRLPATGAEVLFPVVFAVLALISGGVLVAAVRGRRREDGDW
jgi:uncharacterized repeat protein (TIGR01451 family)